MGFVKAVDEVALLLEFTALQIRQVVNGVDIVKGIPVRMKAEFAGVKLLQGLTILLGHGGQAAGDTADLGILDDRVQDALQIAVAPGERVDAAAVKLGKQQQEVIHKGRLLATPQEQVDERVFTAPFRAVH